MPPAQKGLLFSVQDVIASVQNGESDFEMDSGDTDASDSENEDAGEMDKEKQMCLTDEKNCFSDYHCK